MNGDWPAGRGVRSEWRMTEAGAPTVRYTSQGFADLEAEKLWPHTWQIACRQEQVPNPGDYNVYEILDQSIVVVRQADMSIKAFYNYCPHRGTALAKGSDRFQLEQIVCPFHGWKWKLDGENVFILDQAGFLGGCLTHENVRLKECAVAEFINCVWINMDPNAESFDAFIPVQIREAFEAVYLQDMYFHWHKSFVLEANWKVAQEAFHEGYHVPQTHPQLTRRQMKPYPGMDLQKISTARQQGYSISRFAQGHAFQGAAPGAVRGLGRFPKAWFEGLPMEEQKERLIEFHTAFFDELESMVLAEDAEIARSIRDLPIAEDGDLDAEFQRVIREHYAKAGRKIGAAEAIARLGICHLFPNYTFLPLYGNVLIYRTRPTKDNNPDRCIFDVWSCRTYPEGVKPPAHVTQDVTDPMDPAQMVMFLRQDFSNIPRQQIGMHSREMLTNLLNSNQEGMIRNMHEALDRKLE